VENGMSPEEYFHGTGTYVLVFGVLLSVFGALTSYFQKGSTRRLAIGALGALFLVLWGYFFIKSMSIFYEGDTYSYEVLVPGIAMILAISFYVRLLYRVVEFAVYRNDSVAQKPTADPPTPTHSSYGENSASREETGDEEQYF